MNESVIQLGERLMKVSAPGAYANATLNGSRAIVLSTFDHIATCLIVSGEESGRQWQFLHAHLEAV